MSSSSSSSLKATPPTTTITTTTALPKWMTISIAGVSGMFGWVFTHPFELIKNTNMMANLPSASGEQQVKQSLAESFRVAQRKGLYTGITSGMLRQCVYAPARLGCYPIIRDVITRDAAKPTLGERAIAGASAGVLASALTSPIEVCLVLQTTQKEKPSLFTAATGVYRSSGILGFWSGIGALASRAGLVGVCQVAVHDQVLSTLRRKNTTYLTPFSDNLVVNTASVITAMIYSICTMPFEIARVRMSAQASASKNATGSGATSPLKYHNVVQTIALIAKEEGFLAMYDAFAPYFIRCAVHTVCCFFAIEYLTKLSRKRLNAELSSDSEAH